MAACIQQVEATRPTTTPTAPPVSPRERLLSSIRGCRITIPDLQSMIRHWPQGVHPEIERLEEHVQKTFASMSSSFRGTTRFRKLKSSNMTFFGASWWPFASYEALKTVTSMSIWLFAWDDEIDSHEFSTIIKDSENASTFRQKTMDYVQQSLSGSSESQLSSISTDTIITGFKPVGQAISKSCNDRQVTRFLNEMSFFIKSCGDEQQFQLTNRLPTVEEYVCCRLGTGAVRVCLATIEYVYGITLSQEVMDDEAMQQIWHETNVIIGTTNDILSFKKEIAQSQVDSLVALLSLECGSVQAAVNHAVGIVRSATLRLEAAERDILDRYSSMPAVQEDIRKFVEGCKHACTSNLNWSLTSGRYRLNCQSMKGGLHVTL
ncbi:terpenoid synthase [Annulohypoxylon maeteangense]|uniref:terpenoid synthase n=1 Tax=Annulohypoxylon maeteangense TaxID=1927788 RepID=UPI0020074AA1|nr:terpenoid synthase [Annulohypoxylon maeteangense]KAI0885574.1 terpenoid synthase [Annulohypoxylon maeteangense]